MPKGIPKNGINKGWIKKGQTLSPKTQFKKGQKAWNDNLKGFNIGHPFYGLKKWPKWLVDKKKILKGENSPFWKGDNAGYVAKHTWVAKLYGKPTECEHCGVKNLRPRQYQWANKSGEYLRKKSDWLRLCISCHIVFDKRNSSEQAKKAWVTKRKNV